MPPSLRPRLTWLLTAPLCLGAGLASAETGTATRAEGRSAASDLTLSELYRIDDPPPANRLYLQSITALRANPLGLLELVTLSYRSRIKKSADPLYQDNFGGAGLALEATPAFARVGPLIELQPLSILRLWATYQVLGYFGSFNLMQSFGSPNEEYSDSRIRDLGDLPSKEEGKNYPTTGTQFTAGANVQIKFGPIAARSQFRLVRSDYDLRDGDRVFYDQFYDVLVPNEGWYLTNDLDLLYVTDFGLAAGARHTVTHAFYGERHFRPGEADLDLNPTMHRVGPFLAYTFSKSPAGEIFNNPTVLLIANWWLSHRYRTGEDVTVAFPYIVLGFMFTGDLWVSARD